MSHDSPSRSSKSSITTPPGPCSFSGATKVVRVHEDRLQQRIDIGFPVEQEHACLRGDREPDLVRDLEPVAALELLLGEKDLDEPPELLLVRRRERAVVRHVALDDRELIGGSGVFVRRARRLFFVSKTWWRNCSSKPAHMIKYFWNEDRYGTINSARGVAPRIAGGGDGAGHSRSEPSRRAPMGSFAGMSAPAPLAGGADGVPASD